MQLLRLGVGLLNPRLSTKFFKAWRKSVLNDADKRYIHTVGVVHVTRVYFRSMLQDVSLRQFLLTNLIPDQQTGNLQWRVNLSSIGENLPQLRSFPTFQTSFTGPTLFIGGGNSNYISWAWSYATYGVGQLPLVSFLGGMKAWGMRLERYRNEPMETWALGYGNLGMRFWRPGIEMRPGNDCISRVLQKLGSGMGEWIYENLGMRLQKLGK